MMVTDNKFNLAGLIRGVLDESLESDPHVLARTVVDRIASSDRDEALRQALPTMVRAQFGRGQVAFVPYDDDAHELPGGKRTTDAQRTNAVGGPTRSRKVSGIREHWRAVLTQRIAVGSDTYKMVSDCGIADLEHAATVREDHARKTLARAEQLRVLVSLLAEHDVATVRELPDAILRHALVEAAA